MIFWEVKTDTKGRVIGFDLNAAGFVLGVVCTLALGAAFVIGAVWVCWRFGPLPLIGCLFTLAIIGVWRMYWEYKLLSVKKRLGDAL